MSKKIVVYIASAYTKGDQAINVRRQIDAFEKIAEKGYVPIAPLMSHFNHMFYPHDYEFYMNLDLEYVSRSDIVIRLDGESKGADREVNHAKSLNIPVVYNYEDLDKVAKEIENNKSKDNITILKEDYDELISNTELLDSLRMAGVDNWSGWDYAIDIYNESFVD